MSPTMGSRLHPGAEPCRWPEGSLCTARTPAPQRRSKKSLGQPRLSASVLPFQRHFALPFEIGKNRAAFSCDHGFAVFPSTLFTAFPICIELGLDRESRPMAGRRDD